jgi:hypothetical protein
MTAGPPGGSPDGESAAQHAAQGGKGTGREEDARCLGVEREPPGEELPGRVELEDAEVGERGPEGRLMAEHRGRPLRRCPQAGETQESGDGALEHDGSGRNHCPRSPLGA